MAHEIFISYSSSDRAIANAACAAIENCGIRCWIAPRDVPPGTEYAESIVRAIEGSAGLVIVFSTQADASIHVRREVERALSKGKFIIPFRVEDIRPTGSMEYCLSNIHWLDALTPPIEKRLDELVESVSALLAGPSGNRNSNVVQVTTTPSLKADETKAPPDRPGSLPVILNDVLRTTAKLTEQRCYRLARQQYRELGCQSFSTRERTLIAYNDGVFDWVHLGDGNGARSKFIEARDLAGIGISSPNLQKILANATENLMILAISYEEFFGGAAALAELSPGEPILQQQVPQTRQWQKEGLPWSEVMVRRSCDYWNDDPQLDPGRYACGSSILHVMLSNRKLLRIDTESYRTWLHTWVTLLFRHDDVCMDQQQGDEAANVWERNVLFEPALPLLEDYVSTHLSDPEMLSKLQGVRTLLMNIGHYEAAVRQFPGPLCPLKLVQAEPAGTNLHLTYQWTKPLSAKEADVVDTRTRAFVNSAVGIAAIAQWIGCQDGPNDAKLLGIPIPGWYLEDRPQPTFVLNSHCDTSQSTVNLTLGMRFIDLDDGTSGSDHVSRALQESFEKLFNTITV